MQDLLSQAAVHTQHVAQPYIVQNPNTIVANFNDAGYRFYSGAKTIDNISFECSFLSEESFCNSIHTLIGKDITLLHDQAIKRGKVLDVVQNNTGIITYDGKTIEAKGVLCGKMFAIMQIDAPYEAEKISKEFPYISTEFDVIDCRKPSNDDAGALQKADIIFDNIEYTGATLLRQNPRNPEGNIIYNSIDNDFLQKKLDNEMSHSLNSYINYNNPMSDNSEMYKIIDDKIADSHVNLIKEIKNLFKSPDIINSMEEASKEEKAKKDKEGRMEKILNECDEYVKKSDVENMIKNAMESFVKESSKEKEGSKGKVENSFDDNEENSDDPVFAGTFY